MPVRLRHVGYEFVMLPSNAPFKYLGRLLPQLDAIGRGFLSTSLFVRRIEHEGVPHDNSNKFNCDKLCERYEPVVHASFSF